VVDEAEDYYERGPGAADEAYVDPARGAMGQGEGVEYFHNVAITGFDVADSWLVTPNKCQEAIANEPGAGESFFLPNAAFYRTALKVPGRLRSGSDRTHLYATARRGNEDQHKDLALYAKQGGGGFEHSGLLHHRGSEPLHQHRPARDHRQGESAEQGKLACRGGGRR
jgi:hypothetical protein